MSSRIFIVLALLFGCARGNPPQDSKADPAGVVAERATTYCELSQPRYKELGYVHSRCDGVGFTSLRSVACGDVELGVFSDPGTGELFRDPEHKCWISAGNPNNGSKSGLSRDMVLMRLYAAVEAGDGAWVDSFLAFAEPKGWRVCEADDAITALTRCQLSPDLISLLYAAKTKLSGGALRLTDASLTLEDFEDHLKVIGFRVKGLLYGALTDGEVSSLKAIAEAEPMNALYQVVYHKYVDGDYAVAYDLLNDPAHWPVDRLPMSSEHCENYLYQRSYMKGDQVNPDWLPCPDEGKTHEATEYSLAVKITQQEK